MSAADKTKLNGIATGANKYSLPAATSSALGGVKTSTGITNSSGTISVAYGTAAGTACQGNDSRLSDSRTPKSHTHGNINNSGQITATESTTSNVKHIAVTVDDNGTVKKMTPANVRTAIGAGTSNLKIGTTSTTAAAGNHTHKYAGAEIEGGAATMAMSTYGGCNFTDIMYENKNALTFDGSKSITVTAHNVGAVPVKMANASAKSEIQMATNTLTMNSVSLADDGTASYIRLRPSRADFYCDEAGLNITASGTNILKLYSITAPTSSGGTTYGLGTSGQVLKSNGTSVYWANDSTTSGSGATYYMHKIVLQSISNANYKAYITVYNKSSTAFTAATFKT